MSDPIAFDSGGVRITKADPPAGFTMAERDWTRLGNYVAGMQESAPWARDALLVSVGVFVTAVVAVIAWVAEFSQIKDPSWVFILAGTLLTAVMLAAFFVAIICYLVNRDVTKKLHRDADFLYHDMNSVHPFKNENGD
jgi:apolipoprotein N-acyltransferase